MDPSDATIDPMDYPEDAELLVIPKPVDRDILEELFVQAFDEIDDEYARVSDEPTTIREEFVLTKGSLLQELLAQLREMD